MAAVQEQVAEFGDIQYIGVWINHLGASFNPVPPEEIYPPLPPPVEVAPVPVKDNPPWTIVEVGFLALLAFFSIAVFGFLAIGVAAILYGKTVALELGKDPRVIIPAQFAAYVTVF